ncbi:MAG: serine/threonine-protein kinase [Candidatus Margulisiibacteriota bacterium]
MAILERVGIAFRKMAGTLGLSSESPVKATANLPQVSGSVLINPPILPGSILLQRPPITDHVPSEQIRFNLPDDHPIIRDFPSDLNDTSRIGDFLVREGLAYGGMAVVLKGYDTEFRHESGMVALKMTSRKHAQALRIEGKILEVLSRYNSDNIPRYIDSGDLADSKGVFLAQEYIEGPSLLQHITEAGVLPLDRSLRILKDVCNALKIAYEAKDRKGNELKFIHRDLKPSNIILRNNGQAVVIDWGLSRPRPGSIVGTPLYMAPEQMLGLDMDHRSDIYAAGVILFLMLTGKNPFLPQDLKDRQDLTPQDKFNYIMGLKAQGLPTLGLITGNDSAQKMIEYLLSEMTEIEPDQRLGSYDELLDKIDQILKELSTVRSSAAIQPSGGTTLIDNAPTMVDQEPPVFIEPPTS